MRTILQREYDDGSVHIDKAMLDTSKDTIGEDRIFDALCIPKERECCRTRLMTSILPADLENQGSDWNLVEPELNSDAK
jgi:hypothetical protein